MCICMYTHRMLKEQVNGMCVYIHISDYTCTPTDTYIHAWYVRVYVCINIHTVVRLAMAFVKQYNRCVNNEPVRS